MTFCCCLSAVQNVLCVGGLRTGPYQYLTVIMKQLKMEGFLQSRWTHKHPESLKRLMAWFKQGKTAVLKARHQKNMLVEFIGMLRGDNIGKTIIAV